jgi:hypothetical protein
LSGYITAKWFLGEKVTGHGISSGPTSTAHSDIFTLSTIVFIPFEITKLKEKF